MAVVRNLARRAIALPLLCAGLLLGSHAWADEACSLAELDRVATPEQALALATHCGDDTSIWSKAIDKFNAMPLPADIPRFTPQTIVNEPIEKITFAADIYFYIVEGYPRPDGLAKLAELVRRLNGAGVIDVLIISSSETALEKNTGKSVAQMRTDFVRRYLAAAGIDEHRIYGTVQAPDHPDTPDGNARDRCARIEVVMHRIKVPG